MKKVIKTELAPLAIGPYSQGIIMSDLLFTSEQIAIDPKTGAMAANDIKTQTIQVMENLKGILIANGLEFESVLKKTVFITDMNYFAAINEIYGKYFSQDPPARSCIQVARLPKDALIEIELVAHGSFKL